MLLCIQFWAVIQVLHAGLHAVRFLLLYTPSVMLSLSSEIWRNLWTSSWLAGSALCRQWRGKWPLFPMPAQMTHKLSIWRSPLQLLSRPTSREQRRRRRLILSPHTSLTTGEVCWSSALYQYQKLMHEHCILTMGGSCYIACLDNTVYCILYTVCTFVMNIIIDKWI